MRIWGYFSGDLSSFTVICGQLGTIERREEVGIGETLGDVAW